MAEVATTITTPDIYERPAYEQRETEQPNQSEAAAGDTGRTGISWPRMLWAAGAIFACNLMVMGAGAFTPELNVGVYGDETAASYNDPKPSPFENVIDTSRPHSVKLAERLRPIVVQEVPLETTTSYVEAGYTNLSLPRASQAALSVRRASESTLAVPRVSQGSLQVPQMAIPVRRASESTVIQ